MQRVLKGSYATLNDQLGLKLVPVKALLEIPVVDRVEMPSEN